MTGAPHHRRAVSRYAVHGLFLLMTALFAGPACAGKTFAELRPSIDASGRYLDGVPFFRQEDHACGPAALAGVLAFLGRPAALEEITRSVVTPALRGALPMDLERYARDAGLRPESWSGSAGDIKAAVRSATPPICLLDLGFWMERRPHYVLVLGFDEVHRAFIVHDGRTPNRVLFYDDFDRAWARAGRWMLVVRP